MSIDSTNPLEIVVQKTGASLHVNVDNLLGFTGSVGISGPVAVTQSGLWYMGQSGLFGITGIVGTTGVIGITGVVGTTGFAAVTFPLVGLTGSIGISGVVPVSQSGLWFMGQSGTYGVTGVVGTTGVIGITGNIGVSGIVGFQDVGGSGFIIGNGSTLLIGNVNGMATVTVTSSGASYAGAIVPQAHTGDGNWQNISAFSSTGTSPSDLVGPGTQSIVVPVGGWKQIRLLGVFFAGTATIGWNAGTGYNVLAIPRTASGVAGIVGSGSSFKNITGATTIVIKNTAGLLYGVCCNTLVNAATLKLYDNTGASGTVIATNTLTFVTAVNTAQLWSPTAQNYWGMQFNTGLVAVTTGTADWTVLYK